MKHVSEILEEITGKYKLIVDGKLVTVIDPEKEQPEIIAKGFINKFGVDRIENKSIKEC